jgi:PAS domain S-box-containing protein
MTKKILIVEDERIIALDIKRILSHLKYEVVGIASSGNQALEMVKHYQPNLILMDIKLEGDMDGIETAQIIREKYNLPVIYLTSYTDESTLQSAKYTEPFGYILKPFEERELYATIEMALYRHKLETELQQRHNELQKLFDSARTLTSDLDFDIVLNRIAQSAMDIMKAHTCTIYLLNESKTKLVPKIAIEPGYEQQVLSETLSIDNSFTGQAVMNERGMIVNDVMDQNGGQQIPGTPEHENENLIIAPLTVEGSTLGAMTLSRRDNEFRDSELALVETFATYASTAVKNAQMFNSLQNEINNRKRIERESKKTQLRLTTIFKNLPSMVLYEKSKKHFFISDNVEYLTGFSTKEVKNDPDFIVSRIHDEERDYILQKTDNWMQEGHKDTLIRWYRLKHKKGYYIWIEERILAQEYNNEIVFYGIIIDNTPLKEAEQKLKNSQAQYKAVVEDQTEYINRYLPDGTLTFVNEAYCRRENKKAHELIDTNWLAELSEQEQAIIRKRLSELTPENPSATYEYKNIYDNKEVGWEEWTYRALYDEKGKLTEFQSVGRDITAQKKAEEEKQKIQQQLHHAQKMEVVGRLAGGIAHDFNNILTVINGYAEKLIKKHHHDPDLCDDVQVIKTSAEKAANMTKQLLSFSRKQVIQPKTINIHHNLKELEQMLHRLAGDKAVLSINLDDKPCVTKIDASQFEQIPINLVVNSRDAMSNDGKIELSTYHATLKERLITQHNIIEPGDYIVLSVKDNGTGIPEDILNNIFEPFFTTKEEGEGTGLGLATIFTIANQAGGGIVVDSEIGKGTEFLIYLAASNEKAVKQKEYVEEVQTGHENILLVEDDAVIREFVADLLSENGYSVIEAESGEEALSKVALHNKPIDLMLSDVRMPHMSGFELANKLKLTNPKLKMVLMSGSVEDNRIKEYIADSNIGFLQKPFDSDKLMHIVRDVMDS